MSLKRSLAHKTIQIYVIGFAPPNVSLIYTKLALPYRSTYKVTSLTTCMLPPPPPIMFFRRFVGIFGNLLAHIRRQSCPFYRQSIWSEKKIWKKLEISIAAQCECIPLALAAIFASSFCSKEGQENLPPPPPPFPRTKGWRRDRRQCPGLLSTLGAASPKSCRLEYNHLYTTFERNLSRNVTCRAHTT